MLIFLRILHLVKYLNERILIFVIRNINIKEVEYSLAYINTPNVFGFKLLRDRPLYLYLNYVRSRLV